MRTVIWSPLKTKRKPEGKHELRLRFQSPTTNQTNKPMKLEIRNTLTDALEIGFADSGTSPIAVIHPERFQTAGGYAETRPDIETARLFAAAPELLEIAQWIADELPGVIRAHCPMGVPMAVAALHDMARAAIAKAERGEA